MATNFPAAPFVLTAAAWGAQEQKGSPQVQAEDLSAADAVHRLVRRASVVPGQARPGAAGDPVLLDGNPFDPAGDGFYGSVSGSGG